MTGTPMFTPRPIDPYDSLPIAIKTQISRTEFLWLDDARKATVAEEFTEPPAEPVRDGE